MFVIIINPQIQKGYQAVDRDTGQEDNKTTKTITTR